MAKRTKIEPAKVEAVKMSKDERKELEALIVDYTVEASVTKALKGWFKAQDKAIKAERERVLKIGDKLRYVKNDVFGGDTKLYGAWLALNLPDVDVRYSSYFITVAENSELAKKLWSESKRMASAQSTARAISKALKPEPTEPEQPEEEKPLNLDKRSKDRLVADLKQIMAKLTSECKATSEGNSKINKELELIGSDLIELQKITKA